MEDDRDIREGLQEFLQEEGYEVSVAENGQQALDMLDETGPAVILLDLMMPIMDGYTFLATIRTASGGRHARIPVVLITAAGNKARVVVATQVAEVLPKPLDLDKLLAAVSRHCGHSGPAGS
ncbi:response regulator [Archangium sp.]|uniref:response regulator n=1 Tax=Archangium sp. TaxID=1872627 RepID=UPI002D521CCC|nr:response regulator [Archangium sp.]HYO59350.1 response regulator [Archangium sp.]